jgi:hypothetical protein
VNVASGLALIAMLVAYAFDKSRTGKWGEMLFGCHVASACIAVGLLLDQRWLVAPGLVFFVGVGLPSWLIYAMNATDVTPLQITAHILPPVVALRFVLSKGVPTGSAGAAWGVFLLLQLVSYYATAPKLNVNLAHRPSPEIARVVTSPMLARLVVAGLSLVTLVAAELGLRQVVR